MIMKILKFSYFRFIVYFLFWFIPIVSLFVVFLLHIYYCGFQEITDKGFIFLMGIFLLSFFLLFIINYYLYDKDTVIQINENRNISYCNKEQIVFHIQDIDLCTESFARFPIGYTKIILKNGYSLYVTNFISLDPIYKMNSNIKRERLGIFRPKILRRKKFEIR